MRNIKKDYYFKYKLLFFSNKVSYKSFGVCGQFHGPALEAPDLWTGVTDWVILGIAFSIHKY